MLGSILASIPIGILVFLNLWVRDWGFFSSIAIAYGVGIIFMLFFMITSVMAEERKEREKDNDP